MLIDSKQIMSSESVRLNDQVNKAPQYHMLVLITKYINCIIVNITTIYFMNKEIVVATVVCM